MEAKANKSEYEQDINDYENEDYSDDDDYCHIVGALAEIPQSSALLFSSKLMLFSLRFCNCVFRYYLL